MAWFCVATEVVWCGEATQYWGAGLPAEITQLVLGPAFAGVLMKYACGSTIYVVC